MTSPPATAWSCGLQPAGVTGAMRAGPRPVPLSAAALGRRFPPEPRRRSGCSVPGSRAVHRGAAGRPLSPGLPAGPGPAGGLPAGTPAGHRLQDANGLATALALWFWKDLERHHPGIDSLQLPPEIAAGWKQRIRTRTARTPGSGAAVTEGNRRRHPDDRPGFYLDLAQWALDEPARWGPWAVHARSAAATSSTRSEIAAESAHGPAHPRTAARPAGADAAVDREPHTPRPGWTLPAPPRPESLSPPAVRRCAGPG